jgi:hypothetical protein
MMCVYDFEEGRECVLWSGKCHCACVSLWAGANKSGKGIQRGRPVRKSGE